MIRKILREPLLHFLMLGAIVFTLFQLAADRGGEVQEGRITVTPGKVQQLVFGFSRTWQRPPSREELSGLVEDHIREEVMYREALAMGLDKDDTIVRRRMRQKLEFVTGDAGAIVAPTDQQLQDWLARNPARFRLEAATAFSQVYFNPDRRGEPALAAATGALDRLRRAGGDSALAKLGDATMLPAEMAASSTAEIGNVFGQDFARQVAKLEAGEWVGPVRSTYGWHLVRVRERTEERSPPLAEVRDAVQREWLAARSKEVVEAAYAKLREKYTIVIEGPQTQAGARSPTEGLASVAQRP